MYNLKNNTWSLVWKNIQILNYYQLLGGNVPVIKIIEMLLMLLIINKNCKDLNILKLNTWKRTGMISFSHYVWFYSYILFYNIKNVLSFFILQCFFFHFNQFTRTYTNTLRCLSLIRSYPTFDACTVFMKTRMTQTMRLIKISWKCSFVTINWYLI